jgi:hypothetical protein
MLDPRILVKPADLDIGGLPFRVDDPAPVDLSFFEPLEGKRLDGILGMDLFRQYVVEMDYDVGLVRFTDVYDGTGEAVPLVIEKDKPYVDAKLKLPGAAEVTRRYLLDSGSGGALADELFEADGEPSAPTSAARSGSSSALSASPVRTARPVRARSAASCSSASP